MRNCQKCGYHWDWFQTLKVIYTIDGRDCPNCDEKQYITSKSRKRMKWLAYLPVFSILLPVFFDVSVSIVIGLIIGLSILMIGLYPFLTELTSKDEGFSKS